MKLVYVLLISLGLSTAVLCQDESQTRSITSDDFSKKRPAREGGGKASSGVGARADKSASARKSVKYKYVPTNTNAIRWNSSINRNKPKPPALKTPTQTVDIGVTIWKLRPSTPGDQGAKLPVAVDAGRTELWTPQRVSATSLFKPDDRVRLAVESARPGHLYLINSEIHSDGTYGIPHLLFPYPVGANNRAIPGVPIEIPDQKENPSSFKIQPKSAKYAGEMIIVVVAPRALKFELGRDDAILNLDKVLDLDSLVDFDIFDREDNADSIYTTAEAEAAQCGTATRDLVRVKSTSTTNLCGTKTRQLTREDPQPQSIYRIKTTAGRPAMAVIRLSTQN